MFKTKYFFVSPAKSSPVGILIAIGGVTLLYNANIAESCTLLICDTFCTKNNRSSPFIDSPGLCFKGERKPVVSISIFIHRVHLIRIIER